MRRLVEFEAVVVDPALSVGELLALARAGLPGALADLGLRLDGGFRVGLDGGRVVVRALVDDKPRSRSRKQAEPLAPPRQRPDMRPRPVPRHRAHLEWANARARQARSGDVGVSGG